MTELAGPVDKEDAAVTTLVVGVDVLLQVTEASLAFWAPRGVGVDLPLDVGLGGRGGGGGRAAGGGFLASHRLDERSRPEVDPFATAWAALASRAVYFPFSYTLEMKSVLAEEGEHGQGDAEGGLSL